MRSCTVLQRRSVTAGKKLQRGKESQFQSRPVCCGYQLSVPALRRYSHSLLIGPYIRALPQISQFAEKSPPTKRCDQTPAYTCELLRSQTPFLAAVCSPERQVRIRSLIDALLQFWATGLGGHPEVASKEGYQSLSLSRISISLSRSFRPKTKASAAAVIVESVHMCNKILASTQVSCVIALARRGKERTIMSLVLSDRKRLGNIRPTVPVGRKVLVLLTVLLSSYCSTGH